MFIGHLAVGLAAKRWAPRASLGFLLFASEFLDVLWPLLVLAGVERVRVAPGATAFTPLDFVHYPWSHSLALALGWSVAIALPWLRRPRLALVVAGCVLSHWVLDFVTHRPDLPLYPGGPKAGLGLWNSRPATLTVELAMFLGAVILYAHSTHAVRRRGTVGFWAFVLVIILIYLANAFGPPPPSSNAVAAAALAMWLLFAWAWWVDRNRAIDVRRRA